MLCPCCSGATCVSNTRPDDEGKVVRRQRICLAEGCGHRFSTHERAADPDKEQPRRRSTVGWRAANPERAREGDRRSNRRREARAEAERQGRPVEEIYAEWGVA